MPWSKAFSELLIFLQKQDVSQSNSCNLSLHPQTVSEFPSLTMTPVLTSPWQDISYSVKEANSLTYPRQWDVGYYWVGAYAEQLQFCSPSCSSLEVLCCHFSMGFSLPVPAEDKTPKGTAMHVWIIAWRALVGWQWSSRSRSHTFIFHFRRHKECILLLSVLPAASGNIFCRQMKSWFVIAIILMVCQLLM